MSFHKRIAQYKRLSASCQYEINRMSVYRSFDSFQSLKNRLFFIRMR